MSFLGGNSDSGQPSDTQTGLAAVFGGPAALGALSGSQKDVQTQNYSVNAQLSGLGQQASGVTSDALNQLLQLIHSQAAANGTGPEQYAQMLQQYIQSGGLPNQDQIGQANQYAQNIFAPQQAALNNTFTQAQVNNNRTAATQGRSINDPVLAAKLAQYQGQQQNVLSGQQTALGSQLALNLPQQQLGFAKALSDQAFQNQSSLASLGGNILNSQQNYALGTAPRTATASGGGGIKGAFSGLLGGLTLGLNGYQSGQSLFGGSSGGSEASSGGSSGGGVGALAGIAAAA